MEHVIPIDELKKESEQEASKEGLLRVVALYQNMLDTVSELEKLEEQVKDKQELVRRYSEQEIPDAMQQLGVSKVSLNDGTELECIPDVHVSITKVNEPKAFKWLRDNKHGDIIKGSISCSFKAGEEKQQERLKKLLIKSKFVFDSKESIHHATLKAFVKEMLEEGTKFPKNLFSIFQFHKTKITLPKGKKERS